MHLALQCNNPFKKKNKNKNKNETNYIASIVSSVSVCPVCLFKNCKYE